MGRACDHTGITANSVASVDWMVGFAIQPGRRAAAEQSDRVARLLHEIKKWQGGLMYTAIVVALLAVVMVTPVHAQVHVDIGIHFPAPPPLVVVPETPWVQYVPPVPAEPANLFFYNGPVLGLCQRRLVRGPWIQRPVDRRRSGVRAPARPARTDAVLSRPAWTLGPVGRPSAPALA